MVVRWFYVTPMRQGPGSMCWLWYKAIWSSWLVWFPKLRDVAQAWNLGPHDAKQYSVRDVLELMSSNWTRPTLEYMDNPLPGGAGSGFGQFAGSQSAGLVAGLGYGAGCAGNCCVVSQLLRRSRFRTNNFSGAAQRVAQGVAMTIYVIGARGRLGQAIMREYVGQDVRILNRSDYQAWSRPAMEGCISRYFDTGSGCLDATIFVASGLLNPAPIS